MEACSNYPGADNDYAEADNDYAGADYDYAEADNDYAEAGNNCAGSIAGRSGGSRDASSRRACKDSIDHPRFTGIRSQADYDFHHQNVDVLERGRREIFSSVAEGCGPAGSDGLIADSSEQ